MEAVKNTLRERFLESKENLEIHLNTCEVFQCTKCKKKEPIMSEIKEHIRKEHDSESYICSVIWWNWTFHFLTRPIFCRWGYRHYSVMADTPTPEHPFSGISSRAWVFQNLNTHHQLAFQSFQNISIFAKLSVFYKLAALKTFILGKTILRHNFVPP